MLTLLCVVSAGAGIAYAQRSETYDMKTGHSYVVPIKNYSEDGTETKANLQTALHYGSNCAIVTPEESGKYKVMIQANNYDKMVHFKYISKEHSKMIQLLRILNVHLMDWMSILIVIR